MLVLNGEEDNSRFVMTEEDHRFISEMLPVLIAAAMAESKRANQEEKEKHEKIAKIQAADLKDKTVVLLREVLMEMVCLSNQVSWSNENLIEKVQQARQMQNDTFDDNLPATVTSTNSVNF